MKNIFLKNCLMIMALLGIPDVGVASETVAYRCIAPSVDLNISFFDSGKTVKVRGFVKGYTHGQYYDSKTNVTSYSEKRKEVNIRNYDDITILKVGSDQTENFYYISGNANIIKGKCTRLDIGTSKSSSPNSSPTSLDTNYCTTGMSKCSDDIICAQATTFTSGNKKTWIKVETNDAYKYVVEAKKRGLSCGIETNFPAAKPLSDSLVSNIQCLLTEDKDYRPLKSSVPVIIRYGSFNIDWQTYINIEVGTETNKFRTTFSSSDDIEFRAQGNFLALSLSKQGHNQWRLRYRVDNKLVGTGLCSIPDKSIAPAPACSINALSACANKVLCRRATSGSSTKLWHGGSHSFYPYAVEAKKRGLACGVDSSSPKPAVETKVTKPAPTVPVKKQQKPSKPLPSLDNPLHFKSYGNTYHTPLLPNVIFFIGEIEDGSERGFRKALRNHKVDTVVLISDGGLVGIGLELANIINDNNLSTYVPLGERCASACSFMFFAGNSKVAHGQLGVHQFYVDDDKKKMAVGKVQKGTQYLIADIIENLEAFGTPSSVYPKMLSESGMYFFSEEEKSDFHSNPIDPKLIHKMNELLVYLSKSLDTDFDDSTLNSMPTDMKNSLTQLELVRIGCMKGPIDGVKGESTKSAIQLFSSKLGYDISEGTFSDLFRVLNNTKVGTCY
jgi:hypothetical protein